jgi:small subunit ribosomal protein S17
MVERGVRKKMLGSVVSNSMDKTVVVLVERLTKHRTYKKYIRKRAKYMAHDPKNECQVGDKVRVIESRPLSKRKRWKVLEIVKKSDSEI